MKKLSIAALAAATLAASANARAETPATANKPNVGAAVMYGVYTGDGDVNPYGIGFGVNGGYTLDMGLHVGAGFNYFLGESTEVFGTDVTFNTYQLMGIVGYDLGLTPELVLRPQLGVGLNWAHTSVDGGDSETKNDFAITPGAKLLYDLGGFYVSGEAAYHHVFIDEGNGDALFLGLGAGLTF